MGKVQGVREKAHMPVYDAFFVPKEGRNTFGQAMTDPRMIRFFVDVQNKTKLETNLQAAGVLPSLNAFEARAMRVVVATTGPYHVHLNKAVIRADAEAYKAAANDAGRETAFNNLIDDIRDEFSNELATANSVLAELIYNSVTTLIVGEKIMIETPTFYFPSGAGVSMGNGHTTNPNHGNPDPLATFRFAEPVIIEPQQNFRVEMLFPQGVPGKDGVPGNLAEVRGPFRIWVVLDGYLTRDVQ
jgi:hypothetical protein